MPVAPFGKHGGRIKLAKYTVGIPRRHSEALIKHPSEDLLVFPLSSSVSPPPQAFPFLSRGSTAGSACLPKVAPTSYVKPGSVAEKKKKKKTREKLGNETHILIQFSANSPWSCINAVPQETPVIVNERCRVFACGQRRVCIVRRGRIKTVIPAEPGRTFV